MLVCCRRFVSRTWSEEFALYDGESCWVYGVYVYINKSSVDIIIIITGVPAAAAVKGCITTGGGIEGVTHLHRALVVGAL
jgi:hypothetical protein